MYVHISIHISLSLVEICVCTSLIMRDKRAIIFIMSSDFDILLGDETCKIGTCSNGIQLPLWLLRISACTNIFLMAV